MAMARCTLCLSLSDLGLARLAYLLCFVLCLILISLLHRFVWFVPLLFLFPSPGLCLSFSLSLFLSLSLCFFSLLPMSLSALSFYVLSSHRSAIVLRFLLLT